MIPRLDFQGDLTDIAQLAEQLSHAGLSPEACREKAQLLAKTAAALGPADDVLRAFFVPGRIEVLGKHTDYAGGRSMVVATDRGFALTVRPRSDCCLRIVDALSGASAHLELSPDVVPQVGHWSNYPATVARRIARNFPEACHGAEIAFASDLPPASGMSSSSALIVAVFLALADVNHLAASETFQAQIRHRTDLAGYLGTVENGQTFGSLVGDRGVGTFGGSEDHTAILNGRPRQISQYAYCPVRFERAIPLPADYVFAVASSGVVAEKTGAAMEAYNTASRLVREITELWREHSGHADASLAAAIHHSPEAVAQLKAILAKQPPDRAEALLRRLEHFLCENEEIIPAAGEAMAAGDPKLFGQLVDRSQQAAERLLGNQVEETVFLARAAREAGAVAASAFGAGFGGSVWALVTQAEAEAFLATWKAAYLSRFPQHASAAFFLTQAGPAAFQVR